MDLYPKYKSPLGYEIGDDGIDSYGVNHSGFSTRDELEYQMARQQREQQLMQNYNNQGITQDYPQYGTDFWGDNTDNNYGFGTSDISGNVQNITNMLDNGSQDFDLNNAQVFANSDYTVNTESLVGKPSSYFQDNNQQKLRMPIVSEQQLAMHGYELQQQLQQSQTSAWDGLKNFAQNAVNTVAPYTPTYYAGYAIGTAQNTFNKLKDLYGTYKQNGATYAAQQYGEPSVRQAIKAADCLSPLDMSDVNKHQYVSCVGSTGGPLATAETLVGGVKKEIDDYNKKMNNQDLLKQYGGKWGVIGDGFKDLGNDIRGAWKGLWSDNPEECEELLPEQYRKKKRYW